MKYYAWLKQRGEGCDYTIGCGSTLVTIDANGDDEAREKLKELIIEQYYGETELKKVLLFKNPIDFNISEVYTEMRSKKEEEKPKDNILKIWRILKD